MYLIKNIIFNQKTKEVKVKSGIQVGVVGKQIHVKNSYFGKAKIHVGDFADLSKLQPLNELYSLLSYVSDYESNDIGDGYKELSFHLSTYQPENIDGYIIFITSVLSEIVTNGEKLFGRYINEIVAVLKEGQYIEFEDRRIEVINNKLVLYI